MQIATIERLRELSAQIIAAETAMAYVGPDSPEYAALEQDLASKYDEFETLAKGVWVNKGKLQQAKQACAVIAKHYADLDPDGKLAGLSCEAPMCDRSVAELIVAVLEGQPQTNAAGD